MNQTPLNPDGVLAAHEAVQAIDGPASIGSMEIVDVAVSAYLAVAQPVVNSFDPRELNRRGWTCGCEPGNYDSCDECQSACNELADFLNNPEVSNV